MKYCSDFNAGSTILGVGSRLSNGEIVSLIQMHLFQLPSNGCEPIGMIPLLSLQSADSGMLPPLFL
jgi:hypothetical protein